MKRIALYHLETLYWIDQLGTFAAAAERLNTTQPAISSRVHEIEQQLGIKLFARSGRRMVLNAKGRHLVAACEPLRTELERTLHDIVDYSGASGIVRIGSGEIAAASCLPDFIQTVAAEMPGIVMEVTLDLTATMLQNLMAGTIDLAFIAGPARIPGVITRPIGSLELCWVGSEALALAGPSPETPVWTLPPSSPLHAIAHESLRQQGLPRRLVHSCNNVRMLIEVISSGAGMALLPETMIRSDLQARRMREVLPRPDREIHFEVAVRAQERDPVVQTLFERAGTLRVS